MGLLQEAYKVQGKTYTPKKQTTGGLLKQARTVVSKQPKTQILPQTPQITKKPTVIETVKQKVSTLVKSIGGKQSAKGFLQEKLKTNIDTTNLTPEIKQKVVQNLITQTPVANQSATLTPTARAKADIVTDLGLDKIKKIEDKSKVILKEIAKRTSGTGIVATIKSASPEVTFKQAYETARKSQQENDDTLPEQFVTGLKDTLPQTALGIALGFVPLIGAGLSTSYWAAVSAGSEIEEKGYATPSNVAIDVIGDRILGDMLGKLFKTPAKSLFKIMKQAFVVEGGTEPAQDLLKFANDYRLAKTKEERDAIMDKAKNYITSGQILIAAGVGGLTGSAVGGVVGTISNQSQKNIDIQNKQNTNVSEDTPDDVPPGATPGSVAQPDIVQLRQTAKTRTLITQEIADTNGTVDVNKAISIASLDGVKNTKVGKEIIMKAVQAQKSGEQIKITVPKTGDIQVDLVGVSEDLTEQEEVKVPSEKELKTEKVVETKLTEEQEAREYLKKRGAVKLRLGDTYDLKWTEPNGKVRVIRNADQETAKNWIARLSRQDIKPEVRVVSTQAPETKFRKEPIKTGEVAKPQVKTDLSEREIARQSAVDNVRTEYTKLLSNTSDRYDHSFAVSMDYLKNFSPDDIYSNPKKLSLLKDAAISKYLLGDDTVFNLTKNNPNWIKDKKIVNDVFNLLKNEYVSNRGFKVMANNIANKNSFMAEELLKREITPKPFDDTYPAKRLVSKEFFDKTKISEDTPYIHTIGSARTESGKMDIGSYTGLGIMKKEFLKQLQGKTPENIITSAETSLGRRFFKSLEDDGFITIDKNATDILQKTGSKFSNHGFVYKVNLEKIKNGSFNYDVKTILSQSTLSQPNIGEVSTPENELLNEARKYKIAEEFVSNQISKEKGFRDSQLAPNANDYSIKDVFSGKSNQPKDILTPSGLTKYNNDNFYGKETIDAINNAQKTGKITIYRAVPKDVGNIENGDWIYLVKNQALDHGEHRFGEGEYKIIRQEVPAKDIYWDGNDIREWGYDNGSGITTKTKPARMEELRTLWKKANEGNIQQPKNIEEQLATLKQEARFLENNSEWDKLSKVQLEIERLKPQPNIGGEKFRREPTKTTENKLIVQHNLSEEKLLYTDKMGGLSVPSLAISGQKAPMENFGEITLIGDKELISPSKTSAVYSSDVYSPRYPRINYLPNENAIKYLKSKIDKVKNKTEDVGEYTWIEYFKESGRQGIYDSYMTNQIFYAENNKTKPESRKEVYDYVEQNANKYNEFVNDIVENIEGTEQIFMGYTPSGNRKYKENTLENVVEIMKKEIVNAEGFNYGVPNIRATLAKKFKSIREIQQNRDKIISKDEMEELKGYFDEKFDKIATKATEGKDRNFSDFANVVADGIKFNSLESDLKEYGYGDIDIKELKDFLSELKVAQTEYFEAKLKRAVDLSEFKAAVVPYNVSQKTIDLLKKKGLKIYKYGREDNQGEFIAKIAEKEGTLFRLGDDYKNATGKTLTDTQEQEIIELNKQIFGDENLKITAQILTPEGQKALGAYRDGIIKILGGQADATDTYLHEAVHKYFDIFLTEQEQVDLLLEAKKEFGGKDFAEVEENLAENLINYVNNKKIENSKINNIFEKFINRVKKYFKNETKINKFYEDILSGKAKKKSISQRVATTKNITDVKRSLKSIQNEFEDLKTESEGLAVVAQEQRAGLNVNDIAKLKRIYARSRAFQEGDVEAIRASKHQELVDRVVEDVMIKYPEMSEQEAFDFSLALPTKTAETIKLSPEAKKIKERLNKLKGYLDILKDRQQDLKIDEENTLYDEWKSAMFAEQEATRVIEVPRSQLPVGEGKQKVSRLEARVKNVLDSATQDTVDQLGLTTYEELNKKENIAKASEYVINNPDDAIKVLTGEIEAPKGILRNAIYVAMENMAKGDLNLARKLASITSTRLGQEIGILSEIDKESPVRIMKDVIKIKEEAFKKKYGGRKVSDVRSKMVSEIKTEKVSNSDWSSFINSIKC